VRTAGEEPAVKGRARGTERADKKAGRAEEPSWDKGTHL